MSRFKVGDTVKVVSGGYGVSIKHIGCFARITHINGKYGFYKVPGVRIQPISKDFTNYNKIGGGYDGWIAERSFELCYNYKPVEYDIVSFMKGEKK